MTALLALVLVCQEADLADIQKRRDKLGEKPAIADVEKLAVEASQHGWAGLPLMTKLMVEALTLDAEGNETSDALDTIMDALKKLAEDKEADKRKLADAVFEMLTWTESIGPAHPMGDLMAEYGDRSDIPRACRELDENKRYGAKKGIGVFLNKHNDRRVVRPMVDRLADEAEKHWVKVFCRSGLAAVSDPAAVPAYVYLLRARKLPEDVQKTMLKALPDVVLRRNPEGLKREEAMRYWDDVVDKLRPEAKSLDEWNAWLARVIELATTDPKAADAETAKRATELVAQLGDEDFEKREKATQELIKLGDAARAQVLAALDHKDPEVRGRASKIIASLEHVETAEGFVERNKLRANAAFLVELLADPSKDVRARAAERLKGLKVGANPDASDEERAKFVREFRER